MGLCQWVTLGMTSDRRSRRMSSSGVGLLRRRTRQSVGQFARLDTGQHRVPLHLFEVVGHDVSHLVQGGTELGRGHVAGGRSLGLIEAAIKVPAGHGIAGCGVAGMHYDRWYSALPEPAGMAVFRTRHVCRMMVA